MVKKKESVEQRRQRYEHEHQRAKRVVWNTSRIGLPPIGLLIFAFAIYAAIQSESFSVFLQVLSVLLAISLAALIVGHFIGFLFGIPKRNSNSDDTEEKEVYSLNSNLVEISDWLTKIIIGVGLVEIKEVPGLLEKLASFAQQGVQADCSIKIIVVCLAVYGVVFGIYFGYNYMRLYLSSLFKAADERLIDQMSEWEKESEALASDLARENKGVKEEQIEDKSEIKLKRDPKKSKKILNFEEYIQQKETEEYTYSEWFVKGSNQYEEGKYKVAQQSFQNALEKAENLNQKSDCLIRIGLCLYYSNDFENSIKYYDKIINSQPDYEFIDYVYRNKAWSLRRLKRYDESIEAWKLANEANPSNFDALHGIGIDYTYKKDKENAVLYLNQLLELNPSNKANIFFSLAGAYAIFKGEDDEMVYDYLKKSFEEIPNLKDSAKTDIRFKEYLDEDRFKELVA